MLFLVGIKNANYCEDNKQFWSRLTRSSYIRILAVAHVVIHAGSSPPFCIHKYKVKQHASQLFYPNTSSASMSRDTQMHILSHLKCPLLVSLGWKSGCIGQKRAADDEGL